MQLNPRTLQGAWDDGRVLDRHVSSSEFIGYNEYGHPQFDSTRTEFGELLYRLKYRGDQSAVGAIAQAACDFIRSWNPGIDVIVPASPSRHRAVQPLFLIADELGRLLGLPVDKTSVRKTKATPEPKNVDYAQRVELLKGAHALEGDVVTHSRSGRPDCVPVHLTPIGTGATPMEFHRGRLIDHVHLVVADLGASKRFYEAVLGALGHSIGGEGPGFFFADELFVSQGEARRSLVHLAFQAENQDAARKFHQAGLTAGGRDNGQPGERPYHPGYCAAYLLDPDGNNIEAVYHGPSTRSAASVVIRA